MKKLKLLLLLSPLLLSCGSSNKSVNYFDTGWVYVESEYDRVFIYNDEKLLADVYFQDGYKNISYRYTTHEINLKYRRYEYDYEKNYYGTNLVLIHTKLCQQISE